MILWGLVIDRLEHLPSQGEEVMCGNVRLVVEQVERTVLTRFICTSFPEKRRGIEPRRNQGETAHKMLAFWDNIC